jgi:glycine cleavage system H protein
MNVPDDLRYSSDHEWIRAEDGTIRVGITDYAQDALGDVVYVEVPEVGTKVEANAKVSEVESTPRSDIFARCRARSSRSTRISPIPPSGSTTIPHKGGSVIRPDDPPGRRVARRGLSVSTDGAFRWVTSTATTAGTRTDRVQLLLVRGAILRDFAREHHHHVYLTAPVDPVDDGTWRRRVPVELTELPATSGCWW